MMTSPTPRLTPKEAPVPTDEELLVQFLGWLGTKDYLVCRVSFGERKKVRESPEQLAADFLQDALKNPLP